MDKQRQYIAIDLKSFFASVECVERGLDALTTNLVVADMSRTEKTICLAVTPSLKAYGIGGRARLFEVVQRVAEVNNERRRQAPGYAFRGKSWSDVVLKAHPELAVDYVVAPPRMAHYISYSTRIYEIYLKYIAPEDIHVYSIDEVFIDATNYLATYKMTAHQLAMTMIRDVLSTTGITATAGIGTNMYLAKIAMDIVAKHIPADSDGVRIAELDEMSYRRQLWNHRPLTSFWRVGAGIAKRLAAYDIYTMGDIARLSLRNENFLYRLFGVNAELLIDHAWGREPVTIGDIKSYKAKTNCLTCGQVLGCGYSFEDGKLIVKEMMDLLCLEMVEKNLVSNSVTLYVGYSNRTEAEPSRGTASLDTQTNADMVLIPAVTALYERIVDPGLLVHRINISVNHVVEEEYRQYSLFSDEEELERNRKLQAAMLDIKKKYGRNAILKGMNLQDASTMKERNRQIGGHKSGE